MPAVPLQDDSDAEPVQIAVGGLGIQARDVEGLVGRNTACVRLTEHFAGGHGNGSIRENDWRSGVPSDSQQRVLPAAHTAGEEQHHQRMTFLLPSLLSELPISSRMAGSD